MRPTLYITRNGLLEDLGQSQVIAYLRGLSNTHRITLITFEKPEHAADANAMAKARADCAAHGITWRPQRFHYRPKIVAPAWSMLLFLFLCVRAVRGGNAQLVHTRSYIPAAVAWVVHCLTGTPFIFDMRSLWPEELITAGRLRRGSWLHRIMVAAERVCLRDAAAVVSLTHAAVDHLRATYPAELKGQRIAVIPTCTDLDRFTAAGPTEGPPLYGCIGTVLSGWFRLDWLATFFRAVAERDPEARFEVVTRCDAAVVRAAIGGGAAVQERLKVYPMPADQVHEAVQRQSVSAMFYAGGEISELGRSPTRMGEILGCGLPVVANAGVGDVARIIETYGIGVLVEDNTEVAMTASLERLAVLRSDPGLAARCRRAAEAVFSLERGTEAYRELYGAVLASADQVRRS